MRASQKLHLLALIAVAWAAPMGAQNPCPISYGSADDAKPNKLYLYFPTADDATYPEFGFAGITTSPAHRFDVAELPGFTGTVGELRDAVTNVVSVTYCEFNVQVRQTTTAPPTTFARRNTVAIGTDTQGTCAGSITFGLAQAVDVGDPTAVDFARAWAGGYQLCAASAGGALNGANSTLERWARSIGGTAAHEAGHDYGLSHPDGLVLAPGEDALVHHLMAAGGTYSFTDRAGYRRHFSNNELSILAANVGLSIQTMWNWDLVNPDAATASRLRMSFLSTKPSLILSWSYTGNLSPWSTPTITGPSGTTTFKGTTYNRYQIEWATGQAWQGPTPGQVTGGARFHVGATFSSVDFASTPDPIIITDIELLDAAGNPLALKPRALGFDSGTPDAMDGTLSVRFFNFAGAPLILRDVMVRELPRVMSLNAMIPRGRMVDVRGMPFQPWPEGTHRVTRQMTVKPDGEVKIPIARLNQRPHVRHVVTQKDCDAADRQHGPDVAACHPGVSVDLFPATTVYITATVVDPRARIWNPKTRKYEVGPLESQLFYQIAGRPRNPKRQQ